MKHNHYFKPVAGLAHIDVYRVLRLFEVTDPCLQHAIKKMLVAGGRGAKDIGQDVQEAIDTLERWKSMREEEVIGFDLGDGHDMTAFTQAIVTGTGALRIESVELFDEKRADTIGQNGNDGEHYAEKEPERPRHVCMNCAQGHATHRCAERHDLNELALAAGGAPVDKATAAKAAVNAIDTDALVSPSGKPSWDSAPTWAMWLTQGKDGVWTFWQEKPHMVGNNWVKAKGPYQVFNSGDVVGRWQDTLEEAPGRTVT